MDETVEPRSDFLVLMELNIKFRLWMSSWRMNGLLKGSHRDLPTRQLVL